MPIYLLDTNIIVFYLKNPDSPITSKFHIISSNQFAVCSVIKAELFYGAAKSNNPVKSQQIQEAFLSHLVSFPFDDVAVDYYAKIRANLEKQGKPMGGNDTMIASIALANQLILVTANVREFARIDGLTVENWIELV